jgi:hypothetical protein
MFKTASKTTIALCGLALAAAAGCGVGDEADGADVTVTQGAVANGTWGNCPGFPDDFVCACQDVGFGGQCRLFDPSARFFMNLSLQPFTPFNDTISSLVVGPAAKAKFCVDAGGQGLCHLQPGIGPNGFGIADLRSPPWGSNQNDVISTIRVDELSDNCQAPTSTQVAIFDDINFNSGTAGDCVLLKVAGEYPQFNLNSTAGQTGGGFGLNDNDISSIKSAGMRYTIWDGPHFTGAHFSSTTTVSDLRSIGWNDRMSSIVLSTCSHDLCTQGAALPSSCDPCASKICTTDPFCCTNSWDSICDSEVSSICGRSCS